MLELGDEFYLCGDNFEGEAAIGKFAAPAAGKTAWVVADAKAEKGLCIEIEDAKDLIMGQVNEGSKMFRCRVIAL